MFPQNCAARPGLEMQCTAHVRSPPVFFYNPDWVIEEKFCHLNFTVAESKRIVGATFQVLLAGAEDSFGFCGAHDRAGLEGLFLMVLRSSLISLINFIDLNRMLCDCLYVASVAIMTYKAMMAVNETAGSHSVLA